MRWNRKQHNQDNPDRWLLTYADMITLLMALFIMMYSMSVVNLSRFKQAAVSIREGFKGEKTNSAGNSTNENNSSGIKGALHGDIAGVPWNALKSFVDYVESNNDTKKSVNIGEDSRGIVITMLSDNLLFKPGDAEINPSAIPVVDKVASLLKNTRNFVQIEGHTCDLKPRNSRYPTNWELSTARATNVLRYLTEVKKLPGWRFSVAGYGSVKPAVKNLTEADRRKNRRVEIIILRPGETKPGTDIAILGAVNSNGNAKIRRSNVDNAR